MSLLIALAAGVAAAQPLVIAHRGASGDRPEHTLAAYELAIDQGADFIEPDLVPTKDGVLVARHENEISGTTNVADRPEFARRKATKTIDGQEITGWFTEDFTLAELNTLRAKERIPQLRSTAYDGQYQVPTLKEVIALVKRKEKAAGRRIGLYPETKHPSYFAGLKLAMEKPLVAELHAAGYRKASDPVFIQSFEIDNLRALKGMTKLRLVQLIGDLNSGPPDRSGIGYATMVTAPGLKGIAAYASGVGPEKSAVIPRGADGKLAAPTALVKDAHAAGLVVHPYTFRQENYFLAADFKKGGDPRAHGDLAGEVCAFLKAGVDGVFSDNPGLAVAAVKSCKP
ncbi:glycerophosphodiester phosphodiesterase [Sphingoaurantiacus capsulatus]|uniref:glycerophosphodiester phosphodiesterase n=1 Tax=Sphingoaurantiacus capsulatus TaxID=1771310 RepID=A0ABV7XDE8_9SPHN